jgi:hypothetical protein
VLDVGDGYFDLTEKTKEGHRWAFSAGFDWTFQCFTDTYIDTERLLTSGFQHHDYTGNLAIEPYPFLHGGPGYWLSPKATRILLESPIDIAARDHEKYEDRWAGIRLAVAGIDPVDDRRYSMGISYRYKQPDPLPGNEVISVHLSNQTNFYSPEWMRQVHAARFGLHFAPTVPRTKKYCQCKHCQKKG